MNFAPLLSAPAVVSRAAERAEFPQDPHGAHPARFPTGERVRGGYFTPQKEAFVNLMLRNRRIVALAATLFLAAVPVAAAYAQDPPAAPKPDDTTGKDAKPAAPGVVVNANLETYFTYNFNNPGDRKNFFLYNSRDREFGLNYADIRVSKAVTPDSRTGFTVRLIEGDVKRPTLSAADFEESDNLLEAYGSLLVPLGTRDLKVDAGQFVTHLGYETIDIGTNNFFSRAFLFQIPIPFYNAGVRASLPLGARTVVTGFLLSQFNGRTGDAYKDLAPGLQVVQTLSPTASLVFNVLGSREPVAISETESQGKYLSVYELLYINQFTPAFKLGLDGVYRHWEDTEDQYGVAGYGTFTVGKGSIVGLRGEYLKIDPDGGDDTDLSSLTLSFEPRSSLFTGARTLLEFRYDHSKDAIFGDDNGGSKKDQYTLTIGQTFSF